jgi:hypothetical protein
MLEDWRAPTLAPSLPALGHHFDQEVDLVHAYESQGRFRVYAHRKLRGEFSKGEFRW